VRGRRNEASVERIHREVDAVTQRNGCDGAPGGVGVLAVPDDNAGVSHGDGSNSKVPDGVQKLALGHDLLHDLEEEVYLDVPSPKRGRGCLIRRAGRRGSIAQRQNFVVILFTGSAKQGRRRFQTKLARILDSEGAEGRQLRVQTAGKGRRRGAPRSRGQRPIIRRDRVGSIVRAGVQHCLRLGHSDIQSPFIVLRDLAVIQCLDGGRVGAREDAQESRLTCRGNGIHQGIFEKVMIDPPRRGGFEIQAFPLQQVVHRLVLSDMDRGEDPRAKLL